MDLDSKYAALLKVAESLASKQSRNVLLAHHNRVDAIVRNMLAGRKTRKRTDGVTKDNPTGNPFKKLRKPTPTAVSSRFDESLNALRAARDVPDSSFD